MREQAVNNYTKNYVDGINNVLRQVGSKLEVHENTSIHSVYAELVMCFPPYLDKKVAERLADFERWIENLEGKLAEANSKLAFLYSDNSQRALRREPDADLAIRQQAIALQCSLATSALAANAYGELNIDTIISEADQVAHWIKTGEKPADKKRNGEHEFQAKINKAIFGEPKETE